METVKRSVVVWDSKGGRDEQVEHKGFLGQWNYSIWYWDGGSLSFSFVKTYSMYNIKSEPDINYGL